MNITNSVSNNNFFDNKYLIGIIMVIINLGARFIVNFMATRDLGFSILLTFAVVIFLFEFFNEDSDYSLVPKKDLKAKKVHLDKNQKIDKIIEELKAI